MKEGVLHAQGDVTLLGEMRALRLHLDDSHERNGPLIVVSGSHRMGILASESCRAIRDEVGEEVLCAPRGSVIVMSPLLLHRSSKALSHERRRVLHFLIGPRKLPHGLQWPSGAFSLP